MLDGSKDTGAFCGSPSLLKRICESLPGHCGGLSIHRTFDRGFLATKDAVNMTDDRYELHSYTMVTDADPNPLGYYEDQGGSWGKLLRFKDISFTVAGTYKACFCDSRPNGLDGGEPRLCLDASDYSVDLGEVHVSGVSCLFETGSVNTRVTCNENYWGSAYTCGAERCDLPLLDPVPVTERKTLYDPLPAEPEVQQIILGVHEQGSSCPGGGRRLSDGSCPYA